ncbi:MULTISPECIES: hypothetical protein [Streptomyces]|uniref:Flp pilus assembly protein RcpC/CpaB domain-containing protein n=1 Tax=Streptomyces griseosporeus TaxID=1910 RepID=A0ABV3KR08_STRGS|nr:hypothetical protein [Streptomyces actuosus]MBM4821048.1 hypothetical protein [Streptomyces actuosus]
MSFPTPSSAPSFLPTSAQPPGADAPPPCEVPHFAPVRVRGARVRLYRLLRHRRRAVAAGLAVTAAALVAAGPRAEPARGHPDGRPSGRAAATGVPPGPERRAAGEDVAAPVRIADAATVRLLRPGDRVDVVAAGETAAGGGARVVARGALVTKLPEPVDDVTEAGALVVLSVPRATAARLVGAGVTARLAVTLC